MSKRIKELIEQCIIIEEYGWGASYENFDREKFAELIVRECASVCENSNYEFGTIFTKMIKEHFGVEE